MQTIKFKIVGRGPCLQHNNTLVNPFSPKTVAFKQISGKRKKTEDDLNEMSRLEWEAGLYIDDKIGPHWPGANIQRMVLDAAKLSKRGKDITRGVQVLEDKVPLQYKGPRDMAGLFADGNYVDVRPAKNGPTGGTIMRTRPIFPEWSCEFSLNFDPEAIDGGDLVQIVHTAGQMIGLSEYRPRFGRFDVIAVNGKKVEPVDVAA